MNKIWYIVRNPRDDKWMFRSNDLECFLKALRFWLSSDTFGSNVIVEKIIEK